jgi:hypothetical protein
MNDNDKRLAHEQAQAHPPSMAAVMGEDLGPPLFTDQPPEPSDRSTASRIARGRHESDQQAAHQRDLHLVDRAAEHEADELAYAKAVKLRRAGKSVPPDTAARAARVARGKGLAGSSAEQLAAQALPRRGVTDDDDRRHGRRPRR